MKLCTEDTVPHLGHVLLFQKNEELCDLQQHPIYIIIHHDWSVAVSYRACARILKPLEAMTDFYKLSNETWDVRNINRNVLHSILSNCVLLPIFSTPTMRLTALSVASISSSVDHLQSHFHLTDAEDH